MNKNEDFGILLKIIAHRPVNTLSIY